jgi:(2R)-3-sulfolactate dehydrogenase (NADP+)
VPGVGIVVTSILIVFSPDPNMNEANTAAVRLTLGHVQRLANAALRATGTSETNACSVARSIASAEAEGLVSHGLMRLPTYCDHVECGKVDGCVEPVASSDRAGAWRVDARHGFAHPAIDLGFRQLAPAACENGIAALSVVRSYNCGVLGYHVERLARRGLVALAFVNSPPSIAPWGGSKAFFGTNPIACAAPRKIGAPLVIDQSASVVARGEVMLRAREGKPIPEGWALDREGRSTTNAHAALDGSMLPSGGYKGAGIALMVEIMAAVVTGASLSAQASSFADNNGGPPGTGQFFIAIYPEAFAGGSFSQRLEDLIEAMCSEPHVRLPGARRAAAQTRAATEGIGVSRELYDDIAKRAGKLD